MNNELLKELIEKASTSFGNEIIDVLEQDFDAKIDHVSEEETYRGIETATVLSVGDEFVMVEQEFYRLGYKDYDHYETKACMVSRREEVITHIWWEPIEE